MNFLINYQRLNPSIKINLGNDSNLTATHEGPALAGWNAFLGRRIAYYLLTKCHGKLLFE
jgi:hypothetical protein